MKTICEVCKNLPITETKSEFIHRHRENNKRAYSKYTTEEIRLFQLWFAKTINNMNLTEDEFSNLSFNTKFSTRNKKVYAIRDCMNRLSENSGRSVLAIITRLQKTNLINIDLSHKGNRYYLTKKLRVFIEENLDEINNLNKE